MSNNTHIDAEQTSLVAATAETDQANMRLAVKLLMLVAVIFLVTLWKFRPV
jgi:hypothetical protein